jgi:hypothetical protein
MRNEEFFRRGIWAHFSRRMTPRKTGLSAAIFFAASPQKRISAAIQAAWASNDFVKQNRDQPLARPRAIGNFALQNCRLSMLPV